MCVLNATYQPSVEDLPEHGTLQIQIHTSDDQSPHAFQHCHKKSILDCYLPQSIKIMPLELRLAEKRRKT